MSGYYDIFLSHAFDDSGVAETLAELLRTLELKVFLAEDGITAGDNVSDELRDRLKRSDQVIVLATPRSMEKSWVLIEAGAAWVLGRKLIPVMDGVSSADLPEPLNGYRAIDLRSNDEKSQFETQMQALATRKQSASRDVVRHLRQLIRTVALAGVHLGANSSSGQVLSRSVKNLADYCDHQWKRGVDKLENIAKTDKVVEFPTLGSVCEDARVALRQFRSIEHQLELIQRFADTQVLANTEALESEVRNLRNATIDLAIDLQKLVDAVS